jgi:hypothetical protein
MKVSTQLKEHYAKLGRMGSKARNKKLSAARRKEIAQNAANARWNGKTRERAPIPA